MRVERGRVLFTHPLYAAAAYRGASTARRRATHRRLSELVADAEERARHRALGSSGPDESVANELAAAARRAHGRGATDSAAEMMEQAYGLSPDDDLRQRCRRGVEAAELNADRRRPPTGPRDPRCGSFRRCRMARRATVHCACWRSWSTTARAVSTPPRCSPTSPTPRRTEVSKRGRGCAWRWSTTSWGIQSAREQAARGFALATECVEVRPARLACSPRRLPSRRRSRSFTVKASTWRCSSKYVLSRIPKRGAG